MSRRTSPRFLCSQLVTLLIRTGRSLTGNLEEIDERVAMVLTDEPVLSGTRLQIHWDKGSLSGRVQHCVAHDGLGAFVTVALDVASRWTPQRAQPEHLISIADICAKAYPLGRASGY